MIRLFDSHCHLDDRCYDPDIDAVIKRARDAGVLAAMIPGIGDESSARAIALAETRPNIFASVGVHPHDARDCSETVIQKLHRMALHPRVKAWGEIGLDFNRMYSPQKVQEFWFLKQLELADALALPVIIHERDSGGRLLDLLRTHSRAGRTGVIHCFSGSETELKSYIDMNFFIGITGILTLKERGRELRRLSRLIPEEHLVVETDAPYLTPSPERNHHRRNEPAFVKSVLLRLAQVRATAPERLAEVLWQNTCRLYRIEIE